MIGAPSLLLAFAAGFVSFVSPCCLPLVPGYLAAISPKASSRDGGQNGRLLWRSLVFVASFSAVFILLGLSATVAGAFLASNQLVLRRVSGIAIIAMGAFFIASLFVLRLNRDFRPRRLITRATRGGPVVCGVAFAFAWTPCVGPTLGAILGLAATGPSTAEAAGLLAVYSAGLALPFLLSAAGFGWAERSFARLRRHHGAIQLGAGALLLGTGALVFTNQLFNINAAVQRALASLGLNFFQSI